MEIYAIFDGHGGFSAAEFASCLLVPQVQNQLASSHGEDQIINTFGNLQKMIEDSISDRSGSTAALYIETRGKSIFSWVGDSSILGIDECSEMRESISKNGAVITGSKGNYRVNGELGVARALGKSGPRPAISAKPSVREFSSSVIKDRYKWICLVTDGVTDVLSLKQIAGLVQGKPESPSINVLKSALAAGAADNLSCIVVEIRGD
ncbi:Oidioi.mRNA.OKI2018_I69.XSR.g14458.t1.cds [Oikopleura dioica]|uniref:Oidioi.mRNA.OKI2018_I69.XSR.g14458.t1.cds n=1 Tax=Oikopleura dioica TaxID=34765 RepID=A0ABN7SG50_OIKDI|nr:Oidioi.mRNA.OKI2018_I69.XSR.g14458.t1.cds [Oikopleura dioica]